MNWTARKLIHHHHKMNILRVLRRFRVESTALMLAASRGHGDLVRLLIERGADVDRQERDAGWSALIWAAKDGRRNSVAILLSQGANPHLQDVNGRNARDWARENGHKDILELLTALPPGSP